MQVWFDQIPFYLNGTLTEDEARQFEAELARNADLQGEVAAWRTLAQAVVDDVTLHTTQLPPLSAAVRTAVRERQTKVIPMPPPAPGADVPPTAAPTPTAAKPSQTRRFAVPLTSVAVVVVMLFVGVMLVALNRGNTNDVEPSAVALLTTPEATTTDNADLGAPGGLSPDTGPRLTAVPPATATPISPPNPEAVIPTNTVILPPNSGGGAGATGLTTIPTNTTVPPNIAAAELAAEATQPQPGQVGDCLVVNNTGGNLEIYQFANTASDVIGVMAPRDSYRTWVHTGKDVAQPFYQVLLPGSEMRLGWVDAIAADLIGLSGAGPCTSILVEPTPTNPAFPGNLPTPISDERICRIAPATGGTVRVYLMPDTNSEVVSAYNAGNLIIASARYADRWLRVDVRGQTAWADEGQFALNGDCANLPVLDTPPEAVLLPTATPTRNPNLCYAVSANGEPFTIYTLPSADSSPIAIDIQPQLYTNGELRVGRISDDGWLQLYAVEPSGRTITLGWVPGEVVTTSGACGSLPYISPTDWAATAQPN